MEVEVVVHWLSKMAECREVDWFWKKNCCLQYNVSVVCFVATAAVWLQPTPCDFVWPLVMTWNYSNSVCEGRRDPTAACPHRDTVTSEVSARVLPFANRKNLVTVVWSWHSVLCVSWLNGSGGDEIFPPWSCVASIIESTNSLWTLSVSGIDKIWSALQTGR